MDEIRSPEKGKELIEKVCELFVQKIILKINREREETTGIPTYYISGDLIETSNKINNRSLNKSLKTEN